MTGSGLFVPAGSGASPILKPFVQPVKAPVEGPAYIIVPITIPAGAVQGGAQVNPTASGMSQVASVVINSTNVPAAQTVSINSSFFWRVGANACLTAPAYWSGGITYLSATLDAALAFPVTLQIALFNVEQTPSSAISALDVMQSGAWTVDANIQNASLNVVQSGAWTVGISNASINVAGSVNANITNATITNTPNNYPIYPGTLAVNYHTVAAGTWTKILFANTQRFSALIFNNVTSAAASLLVGFDGNSPAFALSPGSWIETCDPTYQGDLWVFSSGNTSTVNSWEWT